MLSFGYLTNTEEICCPYFQVNDKDKYEKMVWIKGKGEPGWELWVNQQRGSFPRTDRMGEITAVVNQYELEGTAEEPYPLYKLRVLALKSDTAIEIS
jgi:hypothetical protein